MTTVHVFASAFVLFLDWGYLGNVEYPTTWDKGAGTHK